MLANLSDPRSSSSLSAGQQQQQQDISAFQMSDLTLLRTQLCNHLNSHSKHQQAALLDSSPGGHTTAALFEPVANFNISSLLLKLNEVAAVNRGGGGGGGNLEPATAAAAATATTTNPIMSLILNQQVNLAPISSQRLDSMIPDEHSVTKFVIRFALQPARALDINLDYYSSLIWSNSGDPRASSFPFMSGGPWKLIFATMIYLYLVKLLLPRVMSKLAPMELNWPLRVYNLLMIVSNLYAFYHGCRLLDFGRKCFGCEVIDHTDLSHAGLELLAYGWLFLLSRLIEWLDTIFFVLRKKQQQVTKLHVFHHAFVPFICWTYLKYHPGRTVAFFPLVNTFVHSIMYSYYFLATFGPAIQPYLWWKKYLTSLQIAQFVLILIQLATIPLSSNERCQYPRGFLYVAFAGAILFLWLFYTYYIETYYNNKKQTLACASTNKQHAQSQQDNDSIAITTSSRKYPNSSSGNNFNQDGRLHRRLYREGSSRSLADSIENAIDADDSPSPLRVEKIGPSKPRRLKN